MTFKDKKLNSMTFQALKTKFLHSMTFQVFCMTCTNPAEIFLECYCVARKKPIRCEKTNLQVATVIAPAGGKSQGHPSNSRVY